MDEPTTPTGKVMLAAEPPDTTPRLRADILAIEAETDNLHHTGKRCKWCEVIAQTAAQGERARLRAIVQANHDINHHGPAIWSSATNAADCTAPGCRGMLDLLVEPTADAEEPDHYYYEHGRS